MTHRSTANGTPRLVITNKSGGASFRLKGAWTRDTIRSFHHDPIIRSERPRIMSVDASRMYALDVAGAGLLELLRESYATRGIVLAFTGLGEREKCLMHAAHTLQKHRNSRAFGLKVNVYNTS